MYILNIYDTRAGKHRKLRFNSIDAGVRFIKEYLNRKDVKMYIARLRGNKAVDKNQFGDNKLCIYTYYGDIDSPMPSSKEIEDEIRTEGKFEYRIGTSDPMFYDGFGCIYFNLQAECIKHTSKNIFLVDPKMTPESSSFPKIVEPLIL